MKMMKNDEDEAKGKDAEHDDSHGEDEENDVDEEEDATKYSKRNMARKYVSEA